MASIVLTKPYMSSEVGNIHARNRTGVITAARLMAEGAFERSRC
jgi:hypothetical protein